MPEGESTPTGMTSNRGPEECERRLIEEGIRFAEGKAQAGRIGYETIEQRLTDSDENDPHRRKRNMSMKASEIDDPMMLIDRVVYRTSRLLDKIDEKDDPTQSIRRLERIGGLAPVRSSRYDGARCGCERDAHDRL